MQSSYNNSLIKKNFAKITDSKVISTEYISKKKDIEEEFIEEIIEDNIPKIDPEELLKRYEDIGQRIISDAKREKQIITLKAQMEADTAEKEAYEKGYEQGNKNGYDDGYDKAYNETIENAKKEAKEILDKANNVLRFAHKDYEEYLENKKQDIINLSLEIAENITKQALNNEGAISNIIENAFKISKGEENIIIKINSIHLDELKEKIDRWKVTYNIKNEIFIVPDDFMEPGNAILEKDSGIVKVGLEVGMEQIRNAIYK